MAGARGCQPGNNLKSILCRPYKFELIGKPLVLHQPRLVSAPLTTGMPLSYEPYMSGKPALLKLLQVRVNMCISAF